MSDKLAREVDQLSFAAPVTHVYNPLVYARALHRQFLRRFAQSQPEALFLGMNPGPWGMAQTGVPFCDPFIAREWMGLSAKVERPENEHPARPVLGLDSTRKEGSGQRLWGWAEQRFGPPDEFFRRFFVTNYCPLCFLEESGRNRTPDKLTAEERAGVSEACDRALRRVVEILQPQKIIGVGKYAEARANQIFEGEVPVFTVLHPSPASPLANRGWAEQAERQLREIGVKLPG